MAIPFQRFAAADFLGEAKLLQEGNRSLVVFRYIRRDTEQVQLGECKTQQHAQRLCAITFAAIRRRPDTEADVPVTVLPFDPMDTRPADQMVVLPGADGEVIEVFLLLHLLL